MAVFWMKPNASDSDMPGPFHEHALGPVDQPAGLELVLGTGLARPLPVGDRLPGLGVDGPLLLAPGHGLVDGRDELDPLERLDQVGGHPGVAGLVDEVALAEGGEDEDRHLQVEVPDGPGRGQAVGARHLDVEDDQVGLVVADQVDGLVAAAGLPHHVVPLVLQDLLEIEPDDGLVLGDDHTPGHGARVLPARGLTEARGDCARHWRRPR